MLSMTELLARALASPRIHFNRAEGTDRITDGLISITVRPLNPADILTPEEVAARLKVPESWVYEKTRARCRNPIPCLRLGRYVRFDWNAVITWLTAASTQEQNAARTSLPAKRKLVR
jgi:excisionase family DNA binding protein